MQALGGPAIDFNTFQTLYDSDPELQDLIDNFDETGVQVNTNKGQPETGMQPAGPDEGKPMMAAAAKRAAANFGK